MHDAVARIVTQESPEVSENNNDNNNAKKKAKKTCTIVLSPLELRIFTPRALGVYICIFYICYCLGLINPSSQYIFFVVAVFVKRPTNLLTK